MSRLLNAVAMANEVMVALSMPMAVIFSLFAVADFLEGYYFLTAWMVVQAIASLIDHARKPR